MRYFGFSSPFTSLLTTIIRHRIAAHYEKSLREQQAGFRSSRGCTHQIFSLRQCIERQLRFNRPAVITFIDFAAAFDSVHRDSMWQVLLKCRIPTIFVNILKDLYSCATSSV